MKTDVEHSAFKRLMQKNKFLILNKDSIILGEKTGESYQEPYKVSNRKQAIRD